MTPVLGVTTTALCCRRRGTASIGADVHVCALQAAARYRRLRQRGAEWSAPICHAARSGGPPPPRPRPAASDAGQPPRPARCAAGTRQQIAAGYRPSRTHTARLCLPVSRSTTGTPGRSEQSPPTNYCPTVSRDGERRCVRRRWPAAGGALYPSGSLTPPSPPPPLPLPGLRGSRLLCDGRRKNRKPQ